MSDFTPYHALVLRGDPARLALVAQGVRELGLEPLIGPFLVDCLGQERGLRVVPAISDEAARRRGDPPLSSPRYTDRRKRPSNPTLRW